MAKIKIRLAYVVEVDTDNWNAAFLSGDLPSEVRADVREYFWNQVVEANALQETDAQIKEVR